MRRDTEEMERQRSGPRGGTVCAATLTYKVAPFPADDDMAAQLMMALLAESDKQTAAAASASAAGRWLSRAWQGVKSFAQENVVGMRQADFLRHFSRQLEANAEELEIVMMSARCGLVSMGVAVPGTLYVTNWGFYFVSEEAAVVDATVTPTTPAGERSFPPAGSATSPPPPTGVVTWRAGAAPVQSAAVVVPARCSPMAIKERVHFARVASLLPSVTCREEAGGGSRGGGDQPYLHFAGVPSSQVKPTALQVFTVGPHQIYQFVDLFDVVLKPPTPAAAAKDDNAAARTAAASPVEPRSRVRHPDTSPVCEEVIKSTEFPLLQGMPATHDAFKLAALMFRLWRSRLASSGLPWLHPLAVYAQPH